MGPQHWGEVVERTLLKGTLVDRVSSSTIIMSTGLDEGSK